MPSLILLAFHTTPELDRLLNSHSGPVAANIVARARRVEARAKDLCPVNKQVGKGGGGLKASIHADATAHSDARGLYADVGSDLDYAIHVEKGTAAHVIVPSRKRALWWEGIATPISSSPSRGSYQGKGLPVRRVNHPGTKAQPYLLPSLAAAAS